MSAAFLETSAVLAVLLRESKGPEAMARIEKADRLIASRLIKIEAERAVIRLGLDRLDAVRLLPDLRRELRALWPKVDFIEITAAICEDAGRLCPASRLRTLDAIHLATYLQVRQLDADVQMLSFDARIRAELGLN